MKKGKVICKFILVILLLLSMLPIFVTNTAVAVDLEGQDNTTQSDKVKFKAYFTSSTGTETHSMVADINGQRPEINYQINVEEGRLENPVIKVTDENGTLDNNFMMPIKLSGTSQVIDRIDAENKTIYFRQITDGYITGSFPLSIDATADFDLKKMNQNSKITLTGTYYGDDGSVVSINKSIYVNLGWEANFNIHVAQRISKYIPYNRNGERGITIQIAVRTRLDTATKPYPLPVKKTTVTMQIPTFNGINPTQYAVAAVSTAATNGRDGTVGNEVIFSNANCSADLENHTITIQVENTPENNVVASSLGTDEYLITFDYPASAYDSIMETGNAFLCKTTSTMEVYSNTSTKTFTNTAEDNYTLKEIVGADSEGALEKAIFYRNSIKQESGVEQGYNFNVSLEIQELGTINSLRIEEHDQEFVDAEGNRYSTNVDGVNYIYTNMFAMSKQNFEMIFGTEGYVQVYDKKGTLLGTINKNSPLDENGFYYINLPEKTGPVVSITSKPIVISGTYTYIAHRDISPDMPYTKAEISTFQNLAEGFTNTSRKDGESDYTGGGSAEAMLPLVEPLSQSTISISKQSLEVGKVNENVILTITVKNGAPAKFEWYARPIFDIELPEYITDVEINASRMLYTNDLSIKNVEVIKRNGKNYLRVTVDGESTNLYTKDTTIEINTNLTVDPMTPTVAKDINMYYYNESSVHYYNEVPWALEGIPEDGVNGIDTIQVGFIADPELISVSEISNYESTGKVVNSLEETNNTGKIENNNQDTTANMTLKILNNTFAECTNPVILGRIPTQGNKTPVSGEDLGSTFTTLLAGNITAVAGIEPSQMTIYYSENADATKDIAEPSNGWTTTPSDLKTIKSYLIVTNDFTLPAGEMLQFTYPFTVPANQSYLSTSYGTFGVYYNQNNTAESGKVGLVIPEGEKYTFLLTKTDENSGTIIQNVTFNLNGRGLSVTKYKTNALGQIRIAGLYPNEIYTLSEEPLEGYQVEEGNQIQFKLISESGTWKLQVLKGSFNGEAQITPESSGQEIVASVSLTNTKIKYNITTEAGEGGTISGSEENPYEIVGYGENSTKDIVITPNPNYEIKTIYVNDEPTEIPTLGPDGTVTLDKFTNVTENIHVRVEFQKIVAGGVTVKYIDKATGEEILQQKTQSGYVGDSYSFTREEIASYEAEEPEPTNSTGYLTKDPIEVIFYYKKVEPAITGHSITKTGPEKITSDTDAVSYTIQYQVNVNQYIGEATVTIVDTLPYALDEGKVNQLDGGNYDAGQKTITWVETIENFDTYQTGAKTITFTKNVTLYYKDINYGAENVQNQVSGKLSLKTPTKEDTVKGQVTTPIEITTSVEAVKTWVDNENADGNRPEAIYLQVKNDQGLVQEQKVTGDDWRYTFTGLPKYNADGSVITYTVDEREENPGDLKLYDKQISGNTITNTYKLSNTNIKEPAIDKTGTSTITSKDEQLEYTITYNATVENYIGTGTVTIVDTLPYAIDESKPYDLAGGEYNKQAKTITWVESLGNIDTFQEGAKQVNISKTIQLSYENINVEEGRLVNNVSGKIDLDATKDSDTQTDTFETTENFVTSVEAVKTWVDNEDADGNRPESIYLQVKNGDEMVEEVLVTGPDWKHTFTNLPKYSSDGTPITYTVDEREETAGDLKLYDKQISGNTITNTYKLTNTTIQTPSIDKTGTTEITSKEDQVQYTLTYTATVENYIGTGRVTIVDTLPYEIDETKEYDLAGGSYNKEAKTITWVEELGEVDTFNQGAKQINISKTIRLSYENINVQEASLINNVSGKIDLDATKDTDTKTDTFETTQNFVTSVEAVKTWVDNENADGNRPESIYLQVKNGAEMVEEVLVTGPDWKHTFTNLPKYSSDGTPITYTVDEREETAGDLKLYDKQISGNTITNTYKLTNTTIQTPSIDKTGTTEITSKEDQVQYTLTYTATVENYIGTGRVTIVDTLPYEIDETKEYDLAGGSYNKEAKTITWVEELGEVDTFNQGAKQINISKTIRLSYENINVQEASLINNVSGKIDLDATKDTDTKTDTFETTQNFVTSVEAVKTWVDNENADGNRPESIYLQVKNGAEMVEEALVTGPDWKYTFTNLPKYEEDGNIITYTVDEREAETGDLKLYTKQIEGNTITNTYKLTNQSIQNPTIDKTGTAEITSKDQALTYTIAYTATVDNYIGTGRVTIVDTLPYELDESKPNNLQEGEYNKEAKTITWVEELGDIDTFSNEAEEISITKTITVYYQNINVEEGTLVNNVSGKIDLDTTKETDTKEDTFTTTENFVTSVEVVKTWEDNENADGNRPTAIYLQVKNGEQVVQEQKVTGPDWKHTFNNLPKYSSDGNSITYTVDEREETPGDLTLYNKQISGNTITNTYKLSNTNIKEPTIDKTGTSTITSKDEQLEYTITYHATVENYIGTGTVTIVDTLPYAIDESKPYELDGGNYNKEAKTITWVENLGDIDTFQGTAKEISISKTIQLSYENINVEEGSLVNNVSGTIYLDTTKDTDTKEDTLETTENFTTSVEAIKTWEDNENADGNRPTAIYLQVKNGEQVVQEQKVTGPDWKYTFNNLPKYNSDGTSITYTVDEREETPGDLTLYDKQISGNTITNTYKLTDQSIQNPSIEKTGTTEITSKDQALTYTITYTATIENYIGTGRVTIVDTLPYAIDETKPYELDGGNYDKEAKTITWVEDLGDIDTFQGEAKEINISKTIQLSYENINVTEGSFSNKVSGKIELDTTKDTNTTEDTFETTENFVTSVEAVKTWVDNDNADGNRPKAIYLQVKNGNEVVQESLVTEKEGWKHTFTNLPKYGEDGNSITYTVDEREQTSGDLSLYDKQIKGNTITNTYKLTDTSIQDPSIQKMGTIEITSKDQALDYIIQYTATLNNYIGTGRVTIVDTLPYELDESKPYNLAGGTYNKEAKTITWVEELGEVDTFTNGPKEITITKNIKVYYKDISVQEEKLVNKVSGKIDLDTTQETNTQEDTLETKQNFITEVEVVKTWIDEENADGNRPDAIYLQVKNGEEMVQEQKVTGPDWKYTFTGLPKYSSDGSTITYTVDEREETTGDLELYDKQISGNTITNTYKLSNTNIKEPSIEKTGTTEITSKDEQVEYTITYHATVENYIGTGTVTIVDTLPYAIDETKPYELDGGSYNKEAKTITWVENLGDIDTFQGEAKEITITKTIQLSYENINVEEGSLSNKVSGTIYLDTTKDTDTKEDTFETTENFVTEVEVVKTWVDEENADGNRPDAIYLQVKDETGMVQESLVTEKEGWKHTFTGLPKYKADGSIITYTVDEREETAGDLELYDKQISGNTITNTYKLTDSSIKNPSIEKTGTTEITNQQQAITYTIHYTANIENYIGTGRVTIVDTLPYELDEAKPNDLAGGNYDKQTKTITWVEELGEMDTFAGQTKEINISKTITVYYQNISPAEGKIVNQVTGKVELDTTKETNTKQDTWETTKNFLTEVEVVKTWVDNENADGNRPESIYLQVKNGNEVVQESLVTEKEGWKHTFTGLPKYHADGSIINYTVDEREVNAGDLTLYDKQINGNIITNTYKLSETSIKNPTIEKTGTDVIANETESLTYKIAYNVTIENYLGNAQVTIVDTLPYELDETKENKLDGGTYDAKTKTITWTQTIENIDTYQKESMLVSITKNIEVYYKEIKEEDASFVNTAKATITLDTTKETQTVTDKAETSKNFTTELQVSKIWKDNNNQDGNRPEAIYLQVKDGNTVVQEQKVDETNDWKYTFTGLPKYHTDGSIINYTADEKEVKKGDLTFYQKSINGNVITNTYTLNKESIQNPKIEKEGPAEITEVTDAITYTITYQANVTNYQGNGTLTIVDTLPYPLDETKENNLAGGTYDKEAQTITWVEELSNINAIGDNVQTITWNKAIQVYYSITDDTVTSIRNTVKGTIFLENGEQTDTQEDTQTVVTKQDGSILVHYYLEGTTQKIAEDVVIVGKVGETYQTTEAKDIDSKYELVTVPDNKEGTIGENSQTVIYYYRIKTYEITTEAGEGGSITGSEEKPFEVVNHGEDSQKEIIIIPSTGYKVSNVYINDVPVDFTVREDGTVTLEQIKNVTENKKVVAVFEKIPAGGITIHYVDKETGEELLPTEQIEGGYVGETYVVKRKDILYYNPVLPEPENSKGRLTEGNIDVTFYYQKQVFDITVDKWIQSVTVDGETKQENTYASRGEIVKRDVHAKKTNQTTIEVSYCIRVSNTGEIAGTVGKVIESIPEGMYWNPKENPGWIQDEVTGYIINDSLAEETLNPGEYKELELVLHWKQGEANIGEQINQVFIQDVNNEAQYPDSKPNNDTAQAELLIAISPGIFENHITYIVIAILVLSTTVVLIVHYRTKTKQR